MKSRRKELLEEYKQMKPDMGIFTIRSKVNNKCYLETTQDLKAKMNSTKFKLNAGAHPSQELQREWKDFGEDNFIFEVLEILEYGKDESKTDYREELVILQMLWEDKLSKENIDFYKKK